MPHHHGRSKRSTSRPNPHTSSGSSKATHVSSGAAQRQKTKVQATIKANKPSLIESIVSKSATLQVIKGMGEAFQKSAREHNLARRKKHITKYNTNVPPSERIDMTDEMLSSTEGLKTLREKTKYTTAGDLGGKGGKGAEGIELAKASTTSATILGPAEIQKNAANTIGGPTSLEMSADEILLANKRKGRKITNITGPTGLAKDYKLSKRTLLG